jgi:soluble lytic murein transglycosylase
MESVQWRRPIRIVAVCLAGAVAIYWWWLGRLERSQDAPIQAAAKRYKVDPALIKAVVWRESRFHPNARGRSDEIGLMQIRDEAAHEWADDEHIANFQHEQCRDPRTNTLAGTWYLRKLLRRYAQADDPVPYALADYNAGRGNVLKWNAGPAATNSAIFVEQIGFPGTRAYIHAVVRRWTKYRARF